MLIPTRSVERRGPSDHPIQQTTMAKGAKHQQILAANGLGPGRHLPPVIVNNYNLFEDKRAWEIASPRISSNDDDIISDIDDGFQVCGITDNRKPSRFGDTATATFEQLTSEPDTLDEYLQYLYEQVEEDEQEKETTSPAPIRGGGSSSSEDDQHNQQKMQKKIKKKKPLSKEAQRKRSRRTILAVR